MSSDAQADHAAALLVGGILVRWPGMGRGIHTTRPLAFARVVTDLLESLRAKTALAT